MPSGCGKLVFGPWPFLERQDNWVQAKAFTDYLSKLLPSQEDEWLQMMQQWQKLLPNCPHLKPMPPSTHEISLRNRPLVRQSQWLHGILLGLWSFMPLVQSSEVHVERVLGPEVDTGLYKHPSTFDVLDNGDFYAAYYGGDGEYAWNTAVYGTRRLKGETTWSEPVAIASNPFQSMGNPVLAALRGGRFSSVRFGGVPGSIPYHGQDFRDRCELVRCFPITFEEGTMVEAAYCFKTEDIYSRSTMKRGVTPRKPSDTSSLFLRLAPGSHGKLPARSIQGYNLQPAVVPLG